MLIKSYRIIVDAESIRKIGKKELSDKEKKESEELKLLKEKILSEANEKAKLIVEEAKKKAEKIISDAQDQAKKIVEEAKLSYKEELEITKKEKEKLKNIIAATPSLIENEVKKLSDMILPIVKIIIKKILEKEIDEELVNRRVLSALAKIYDTATITLRVNPTDIQIINQIKDSLPQNVEIQPDPSIESGGVVVESRLGIMDKTTTFQWKMVEDIIDEIL